MNTQNKNIVAIDIAKSSLQIQTEKKAFCVTNDSTGLKRLHLLIKKLDHPYVVCEASGGYERLLVRTLHQWAVPVSVVNPAMVRAFAKSEGIKAKTDPIDARILLKFGQTKELRQTPCPDPHIEELAALMDRRTQLSDSLAREKNRLDKEPIYTRKWIEQTIEFISQQIQELELRIEEILTMNERLSKRVTRMTELKGVGKTTACTILAYLPDLETMTRGQLVSLVGLAPYNKESGKTKSKAHIHGGRAKIRKCLFMAAQSAAQHNEVIHQYVSNLMKAGQPKKSALVAAMRKILICLRSLLKNPNFSLA